MKRSHTARFQSKRGDVMETQVNSQLQQFYQFWKTAAAEQVSFVESFYEELGKVQANAVAQITANLDEAARLTKQSVAQGQQLVAQWRKLALETARKATEVAIPSKS